MDTTGDAAVPPLSLRRAMEHCRRYARDDGYRRISLLGEPNRLPRDGCEISRKSIDQKSLDNQKRADRRPDADDDRDPPAVVTTTDAALIKGLADGTRDRAFITGEGGLGKTEFTRLIALRLAEQFIDRPDAAAIPVRVELGSLSTKKDCDTNEALLTNCLAKNEHEWLRPYLAADRVLFCLDGLDELPLQAREFFPALRDFIVAYSKCAFVLAGRPGSLPPELMGPGLFDAKDRHELQPLIDLDVRRYVAGFFTAMEPDRHDELTAGLLAAIAAGRSSLRPLIYTPFMLALACTVYRDEQRLPANPAELFNRGALNLWKRRRDRSLPLPSDELCFEVLSTLAAYAVASPAPDNRVRLTFSHVEARAWLGAHRDHFAAIVEPIPNEQAIDDKLKAVAPASGLLAEAGSDYVLTNRVAAEFLAARWIARHGYPGWPYAKDEYTPKPTGPDPATPARDQQVMDWLGDHVWTHQRAALVQAVRFELARVEPIRPDRLPKAGTEVALRVLRWLNAAIEPYFVRSPDALDIRTTLAQNLFRSIQPFQDGHGGLDDELRGIIRSRLNSPDEWWEAESDVEFVALLPPFLGWSLRKAATNELATIQANPPGDPDAISLLAKALASAFGGDAEARAALVAALAADRANPVRNHYVIQLISEALASGFGGDGEARAALVAALAAARNDPAKSAWDIASLADALAAGFGGNVDARTALIEALEIAGAYPAAYGSAIGALTWPLASGFAGDAQARSALIKALEIARLNPAGHWPAIGSLATALSSWFGGDAKVRAALVEALAIASDHPSGSEEAITSLAEALARGFVGDADAQAALVTALLKIVRADSAENWKAIRSLAKALTSGFGRDTDVRAALVAALAIARDNPNPDSRVVWLLLDALDSLSENDTQSVNTTIKTQTDAQTALAAQTLRSAYGGSADALVNVLRGHVAPVDSGENRKEVPWVAEALAAGFGGEPVAAVNILLAGWADALHADNWRPFVVLQGSRAVLEDWAGPNGELWRLTGGKPIIHDLDQTEKVDPSQRRAVLIVPREQIRRGLPDKLLRDDYFESADLFQFIEWLGHLARRRKLDADHEVRQFIAYLLALLYLRERLGEKQPGDRTRLPSTADPRNRKGPRPESILELVQDVTRKGAGQAGVPWPYHPLRGGTKQAAEGMVDTMEVPDGPALGRVDNLLADLSKLPNVRLGSATQDALKRLSADVGLKRNPRGVGRKLGQRRKTAAQEKASETDVDDETDEN